MKEKEYFQTRLRRLRREVVISVRYFLVTLAIAILIGLFYNNDFLGYSSRILVVITFCYMFYKNKCYEIEEFESAQDIGDDERMERIMLREEKIDIVKSVGELLFIIVGSIVLGYAVFCLISNLMLTERRGMIEVVTITSIVLCFVLAYFSILFNRIKKAFINTKRGARLYVFLKERLRNKYARKI